MPSELKQKTINGMFWSGVGNVSIQSLQFLFSIILARLLDPEDYGLAAILSIFYALSMLFIDSGFTSALVRKEKLTQEDASTALYFNVGVGVLCYVVLFITAPWIALFYGNPLLSSLLRVYGICIVIVPCMLIQNTMLERGLNFKRISFFNIVANVLANLIAIIMAYMGYGVWALVAFNLAVTLIVTIELWIFSSWRPIFVFSKKSFKYLFNFSYKLLLDGIVSTTINNLNNIVIGKVFSPSTLGFYTKASTLASLPSSTVNKVVLGVSYPVMSQLQAEKYRLSMNYRRLIRMTAYMTFPLLIGISAIAHPLVILIYTEKWAPCIPYLQILCFSLMWLPILSININLLSVLNRTDLVLKCRLINTGLYVFIFVISIQFGIIGLCCGAAISTMLSIIVNTHYTGILLDLNFMKQMKDILPFLVNSFIMGIIACGGASLCDNNLINVVVAVTISVVYYVGSSFIFKFPELSELVEIIHGKKKRI